MVFNSSLLKCNISLINGGEKLIHESVSEPIFVDGEAIQNKINPIEFVGNVQPVTGEERLQLDENDRTRDEVDIYTKEELSPTGFICRCSDNTRWEVRFVERWGPFFKVRAVLVDVTQHFNN